jgi:hypothetical protein
LKKKAGESLKGKKGKYSRCCIDKLDILLNILLSVVNPLRYLMADSGQ